MLRKAVAGSLAFLCGALAPSTAGSQVLRDDMWATNGPVYAVAIANGVVYLGGSFWDVGAVTGGFAVFDASTGTTLKPYPVVDDGVRALASDGSGGWYIGGVFASVRGQPRNRIAHLDASGNLTAWNPNANGAVNALLVSGGLVYAGGDFTAIGGQPRNRMAALDATGAATSWDPNVNNSVLALAENNGIVYAGGAFTSIHSVGRNYLAAIDMATGVPTSWAPNPNGTVNSVAAFVLGKFATLTIYVGGNFTVIGDMNRNHIGAIDAAGHPTSWNPGTNGEVFTVAAQLTSPGVATIYAGGVFTTVGSLTRNHIAAVTSMGAVTAWDPDANGEVRAIVPNGGTIYAAGSFSTMSVYGDETGAIAALDASTGRETMILPFPDNTVFALGVSGGTVCAGGYFRIAGVKRLNAAALDLATGVATNWSPWSDGDVLALLAGQDCVYAGGNFTNIGAFGGPYIAKLDIPNGIDIGGFAHDSSYPVYALAKGNGVVYVGGLFNHIGGQDRNCIAALDSVNGAATTWNPTADNAVNALSVGGGKVYAAGWFTQIGGQSRTYAAALDTAGAGAATNWNAHANNTVYSLAPSGGTVFAAGAFDTIGGQARQYIGALDGATGAATGWNPGSSFSVRALALSGATVYAGGTFTTIGGQPRNNIAQLLPSGAATSWNPGADNAVLAVAVGEGYVCAAGPFQRAGGLIHPYIAVFSQGLVAVDPRQRTIAAPLRAAPNPFRADVTLSFALPGRENAEIGVYDLTGRRVRSLHRGALDGGEHRMTWDGRDEEGGVVSAGLYFVRVRAGTNEFSTRVVRLK